MNSGHSRHAPPSTPPAAREHPIVLFDGVCNFCNASVNFIIAREPRARLRFAPLQSEIGRALLGEHRLPAEPMASLILIEGGRAYSASAGALGIAAHMKRPWVWLRFLRIVPRFARDAAYRFVADRRYRWFGRTQTCRVPTAEERERFLA